MLSAIVRNLHGVPSPSRTSSAPERVEGSASLSISAMDRSFLAQAFPLERRDAGSLDYERQSRPCSIHSA
jgi:hypothetical protein